MGNGAHPFPPPHAVALGSGSEGDLPPDESTLILRNWDGEVQRQKGKDRTEIHKELCCRPGNRAHIAVLGSNL